MPKVDHYKPGDIDLKSCILINYDNNAVDIRHLVIEFNIYSDIYNTGIKADFVMADSVGLIEKSPIVGDEKIFLVFKSPTFENDIEYLLQVYKVSDRQHQSERFDSYQIHCCSQEYINDLRHKVGDAYTGNPTEIVKKIYDKYLLPIETDFNVVLSDKPFTDIQPAKNEISYVTPLINPFKAIRTVLQEAVSSDDNETGSLFMLYENEDGWHINTIDSLLKKESVGKFYYALTDMELDDRFSRDSVIFPYQKIISLDYESQFDVFENHIHGFYDIEHRIFDPIRKMYVEDNFIYDNDKDSLSHIDEGHYLPETSTYKNNSGKSHTFFTLDFYGENYRNLPYIKNAGNRDKQIFNTSPNYYNDKFRKVMFSKLNNIVLNVVIPGNSDMRIGNVIDIFIQQNSDDEKYRKMTNLFFGTNTNSRFLIVAIRHLYNKNDNRFTSILQCVKDNYYQIPVEIKE